MKDLAIYCAGGFGREVYCMIFNRIKNPEWKFVGFFDDGMLKGAQLQYGPCLGGIKELNNWSTPLDIVIANGIPKMLKLISESINNNKVSYPNIIDPSVIFLDRSSITMGKGNILCPMTSLSCNVKIGNFNVFNWRIGVGHEAILGSCNAFMPQVMLSGAVKIGNCNFFGGGAFIIQGCKIGNNVTLGANSTLLKNANNEGTYVGTPAKKFKY